MHINIASFMLNVKLQMDINSLFFYFFYIQKVIYVNYLLQIIMLEY